MNFQVFSVDLVQLIKKVYTMIDLRKHLHLHMLEFRDVHIALEKVEQLLERSPLVADWDHHRSVDLSDGPLNIRNHKL